MIATNNHKQKHKHNDGHHRHIPRLLPGNIHNFSPADIEIKRLLGTDPINWTTFLHLDAERHILFNDAFNCSFPWVLLHYPNHATLLELLSRYHTQIFSSVKSIKSCLAMALHLSSQEVVEFIATHYPQVLSQPLLLDNINGGEQDYENWNSGDIPLHRAKRMDIASILLRHYPGGVTHANSKQNLPLHEATMHHPHPELIRLLIQYGQTMNVGGMTGRGGVLVPNANGDTPLSILCRQISTGVDVACLVYPLYQTDVRLWKNLQTMVFAYKYGRVVSMNSGGGEHDRITFHILHSLIELDGCPPEAIHMALIVNPSEVGTIDERGRYPLTLAASQSPTSIPRQLLWTIIHPHPVAIHQRDGERGRYPLHWAAEAGRSFEEGMDLIYKEEPGYAAEADEEGMLPFMLAACSERSSVDTIYRLLKCCPHVIERLKGMDISSDDMSI